MRHRWNAKLTDLAAALPLFALLGLAIAHLTLQVTEECRKLAQSFHAAAVLTVLSQTAVIVWLGLQFVLVIVRLPPEQKAPGVLPRAAALFGAYCTVAFFFIPRVTQSVPIQVVSATLVMGGTVAATYVCWWLGRSFSILPQARRLVTAGPYRFIRHPLYVAEQIVMFGIMLQFAQPWSLVVALGSAVTQFPRMRYEEQILSQAYPSYQEYAARTARLIPHVY